MSKTDGNDGAFPRDYGYVECGLTKREYIATHVLAGMGAWFPFDEAVEGGVHAAKASWAVAQADALIAALSEGGRS